MCRLAAGLLLAAERVSEKPIENLRPHHLLDALLWPEVRKEESVLFEEFNDEISRYYVLTVLRGGYANGHEFDQLSFWFALFRYAGCPPLLDTMRTVADASS